VPGRRTLDGAIAQLGERLLCKQEVVGSIPTGSTNPTKPCQGLRRDDDCPSAEPPPGEATHDREVTGEIPAFGSLTIRNREDAVIQAR
jgi:hypothetical protein